MCVHAQKDLSKETGIFFIDLTENHNYAPDEKSDTTHYYVVFESYFRDDSVRVYTNDSLVYKGKITTNESIEHAKTVNAGSVDSVKRISIGIENFPLIIIHPIKGKYYVKIGYSYHHVYQFPRLNVRFTKYSEFRM